MLKLFVLLTSLSISIVDIRRHRIPNQLTLLLAALLLFDSVSMEIKKVVIAIPILLAVGYIGKVGAGDIKLLLALLITSGSLLLNQGYFLGMAIISLLGILGSSLFSYFKSVERPKSIAFAPSILVPFAALYLAI